MKSKNIFLTVGIVSLVIFNVFLGAFLFKANRELKNRSVINEEELLAKIKDESTRITSVFDYYLVPKARKQELIKNSKSQILQDIFVLLELNYKRKGFFVEFGAANGIWLSNTYMLENQYGWSGILAEPAKGFHELLKKNRPYSKIETDCVWKKSGEKLLFNETAVGGELSTIDSFSSMDANANIMVRGKRYEVTTISLLDLLKKYNAPQYIDYLSIDTEGSELEILQAFFNDNNFYKIKIITCEHNNTANREKIYNLLTEYGYVRKLDLVSQFDDWYVLEDK